jgi:hypothetical protein
VTDSPGRWKRLLGTGREVLVVVSSILIAFSLDAWWDAREMRREIGQDLANVGRELEVNGAAIRFEVEFLDRIVAATDALLESMGETPNRRQIVAVDTLVYLATATPSLDLSLGAIDALTGSGRLAAVQDADTRLFLAGFREAYADALEEEVLARDVYYDRLFPAMEDVVELGSVLRLSREFQASRVPGAGLPSHGTVSFPNTLAVRNLLERRRHLHTVSRDTMSRLLERLNLEVTKLAASQ